MADTEAVYILIYRGENKRPQKEVLGKKLNNVASCITVDQRKPLVNQELSESRQLLGALNRNILEKGMESSVKMT